MKSGKSVKKLSAKLVETNYENVTEGQWPSRNF